MNAKEIYAFIQTVSNILYKLHEGTMIMLRRLENDYQKWNNMLEINAIK